MDERLFASTTQIAAALRERCVSATEMVTAYLQQIERVNPSINAVVQLAADRALAEAKSADNVSVVTKPLHGVPITLKDSIDTEGIITTYGTSGRRNFVPTHDATVAARLRQAGAIVLGKTNTPEFTLGGECENPVYGKTFNPYKLTHTPGSSSGGSAAIVASGGAAFDLGSDTGGSIREPANFCGLAGIKPTAGRVSRMGHAVPFGVGATDMLTTIGPIARSVDDLELILKLIAGPDGIDYTVVPMGWRDSAESLPANLRIALYTDGGLGTIDPSITETIQKVAASLSDAGAIITESVPPPLPQASQVYTWLSSIDGAEWLGRLIDQADTTRVGDNLRKVLVAACGAECPPTATILHELAQLRASAHRWFQSFDAILCPVEPYNALPHGDILNMTFADMNAWGHMNFYNLTGWPAGTVRAGTTADGLPIGVQLVTHPWREDLIFTILRHIEKTFGGYKPPKRVISDQSSVIS